MSRHQARIDAFLSPTGARQRRRQEPAPCPIQLNFVDPASYTVTTTSGPSSSSRPVKGQSAKGESREKMARRRNKSPQQQQQQQRKRTAAPKPPRKTREWDVDSDSDNPQNSGSEEGTPERLGAVRLEVGKSQLEWGERVPSDGSEGSSSGSDEDEEERQKRRVVVSGDESDHPAGSGPPQVEVIDLESEEDVPIAKPLSPPPPISTPHVESFDHGHATPPATDPLADMFSSDHEHDFARSSQPSTGYTRAARRPPPRERSPSPIQGNKRRRRARTPTPESSAESEDTEGVVASPPPYRRAPPVVKGRKADSSGAARKKRGRKGVVDPDESGEEEDPEALVKELEMDEPVVVESRLRERNKKTAHQERLEALKRRKEAKSRGERYTSPVDVSDGSDELIVVGRPAATAAKGKARQVDPDEEEESEGAWTVEDDEAMDGFIDDADKDDKEEISNLLPEQYQMARYQNLEYHFKVISQFLIHLLIRGPSYARQRKKQYYRGSYEAISRKLQGQKDSLVTSSVWKPDFKRSLETYPEFVISHLDDIEYGCDACHLTGRLSRFSGELRGKAYDRETFEDLEDEEQDEDEDPGSDESDESANEPEPKESSAPSRGPFKLGKFCRLRAEVFHEFSHWERSLYQSYKDAYSRLQRRVRSGGDAAVAGLSKKSLKDPDEVVQWLDSQGHIMSQFERLSGFEFDLQKLS